MAMPAIDIPKFNTLITTEITSDPIKAGAYNASAIRNLVTLVTTGAPTAATVTAQLNALPGPEQATYARLIKFVKEFYPGVDEHIDGHVTYRGFDFRTNGAQLLGRAKDAWKLMGRVTATVNRYLTHVRDPRFSHLFATKAATSESELAVELYKKWFDKTQEHSRIDEVKRIFTNLHNAVTSQGFEIICEGDPADPHGLIYPNPIAPGEFGEVRKGDNCNRFYLGPIFFDQLIQNMGGSCSLSVTPRGGQTWAQAKGAIETALNASTITMLHELTHIRAIGDTDDVQPGAYSRMTCLTRANTSPAQAIKNAENYSLFAKDILTKMQFEPPAMKK
jgi:hypothetical protein